MTRTEAAARYLEAFATWNALGPTAGEATLLEFTESVSGALGADRTPAAWVTQAEAHAQSGAAIKALRILNNLDLAAATQKKLYR